MTQDNLETITIPLALPRDLLGAMDIPHARLEPRLRELIALELFREGLISTGKGAEILEISKLGFIRLLAQHEIPYFTESAEELTSDVDNLEQLLGKNDT
jgi:predicted HTH domain antitoxin